MDIEELTTEQKVLLLCAVVLWQDTIQNAPKRKPMWCTGCAFGAHAVCEGCECGDREHKEETQT